MENTKFTIKLEDGPIGFNCVTLFKLVVVLLKCWLLYKKVSSKSMGGSFINSYHDEPIIVSYWFRKKDVFYIVHDNYQYFLGQMLMTEWLDILLPAASLNKYQEKGEMLPDDRT